MFRKFRETAEERRRRMEESEARRRYNRMIEEMANIRVDLCMAQTLEEAMDAEPIVSFDFDPDQLIGGCA